MKKGFLKKDPLTAVMLLLTFILTVNYVINGDFKSVMMLYLLTGVVYLLTKKLLFSLLIGILLVNIFVPGLATSREGAAGDLNDSHNCSSHITKHSCENHACEWRGATSTCKELGVGGAQGVAELMNALGISEEEAEDMVLNRARARAPDGEHPNFMADVSGNLTRVLVRPIDQSNSADFPDISRRMDVKNQIVRAEERIAAVRAHMDRPGLKEENLPISVALRAELGQLADQITEKLKTVKIAFLNDAINDNPQNLHLHQYCVVKMLEKIRDIATRAPVASSGGVNAGTANAQISSMKDTQAYRSGQGAYGNPEGTCWQVGDSLFSA